MTVDDAAEILNVSIEYVNQLLKEGRLPSLSEQDVATYKLIHDQEAEEALDEMVKINQENGLYD